MAIRYLGNDSTLLIRSTVDLGAFLVGICNRNLEYERTRELIETTTLQGYEVGHVLGLKRGTAQSNNLSLFVEEYDAGYYDELCRQWFEDGVLLHCILRDEKDGNIRDINFLAYIERYRPVRNQGEVANFDISLRQTTSNDAYACPVVSITNVNTAGVFSINYSFATLVLASEYNVQLLNDAEEVIGQEIFTEFGATIEGTFSGVDADTFYSLLITIDGFETLSCPVPPFLSFNIPCPVLGLDVGEEEVDVTLTPPEGINRIILQVADILDPLNIIDSDVQVEPFPDPYEINFPGLTAETTYWVRATIQILTDLGFEYSKECGWIEFTTGTPYEPPTAYPYTANFGFSSGTVCEGIELTVYSDSLTWALGMNLYLDEELTTPVSAFDFVAYLGDIYTIDEDGIVQTDTGLNCD
jgi:hypothetical protein